MAKIKPCRLNGNGQVTIPKKVRDQLGLGEGDLLECSLRDREIVLRPKVLRDRDPIFDEEARSPGSAETHEPKSGMSRVGERAGN